MVVKFSTSSTVYNVVFGQVLTQTRIENSVPTVVLDSNTVPLKKYRNLE